MTSAGVHITILQLRPACSFQTECLRITRVSVILERFIDIDHGGTSPTCQALFPAYDSLSFEHKMVMDKEKYKTHERFYLEDGNLFLSVKSDRWPSQSMFDYSHSLSRLTGRYTKFTNTSSPLALLCSPTHLIYHALRTSCRKDRALNIHCD